MLRILCCVRSSRRNHLISSDWFRLFIDSYSHGRACMIAQCLWLHSRHKNPSQLQIASCMPLIPVFYCIRFKVKDTVRDYIPPDEPGTRKNPLYRKLFDGFDKIDGKPTEAERRVSVPYTLHDSWVIAVNQPSA